MPRRVGSHPGTWQPERPLRSSDTAAAVVAFVEAVAVSEAVVASVEAAVVSVVAVPFVAAVVAASTTSVAAAEIFIASTAVHICLVAR